MKSPAILGSLVCIGALLLTAATHGEYQLESVASGPAGPHTATGGSYHLTAVLGQPSPLIVFGTNQVMRGGFPGVILPTQPGPLPRIASEAGTETLALSWGVVGEPFLLQQSSTVDALSAWTLVPQEVHYTNGFLSVTLPLQPEPHFFRLQSQ
jgi:hypothetical protein